MAAILVGGAFLGAFLNVVFDRIDSPPVLKFIRGKKKLGSLIGRLKTTLTVVRAVLNDAEKKQIRDPHVNDWLDELKHVVYMADDLLNEVATKAATRKKVRKLLTRFYIAENRKMASRLTEIVDSLEHILKLKESLDLKEIAVENVSSRIPSTSVQRGHIYGRDEDKKAIIKILLDDKNNEGEEVPVIPIVGMGGVGKTTLTQMIYNDDNLKQNSNFNFKAWVCVSEAFDIIKVIKSLTEALTGKACQINDPNLLQENLVQMLKEKKFLIVLDDVWIQDYGSWNLLKQLFQYGIRGSKILVTTRIENVASLLQTVQPYHLRQLSYEDSWLVFANHACLSPGSGENTTSLEKIGMEIVKKCDGLPLAAQSLGGSLRTARDIRDWNNVLNSDIWTLFEGKSQIIPSLRVSYDYLHPDLKRCFLYCSLYPKDFEFQKNDMIQLWMAEDLLPPPKKGKTSEEFGDEYFDDLLLSSFLQRSSTPEKENYFGMHDLMHDLATFLGGEFYFRSNNLGQESTIGSKTRHLSFINYSSHSSKKSGVLGSSKFLRTFLRPSDKHVYSPFLYDEPPCTELSNLECLRVLSFHRFIKLIALPDSIGGLVHLRYLNLSWTGIKSLPESVCSLYNLQTLKLNCCQNLTMLPGGMQNLVNLHYLGISDTSIKEMPKGMSKLKQLQHLPYFIVGKSEHIKIKELGGLSNLQGSFSIYNLENVENGSEALEARMMDKKLCKLQLVWSSDEGCMDYQTEIDILCKLEPHQDLQSLEINGYRGTIYPDWVGKPCFHNMTKIKLSSCNNCFRLPSLGHLPSLRDLSISGWKTLEKVDGSFFNNNNNNDGGSLLTLPFPSLESLEFEKMPSWEVWSCLESCAFPLLKKLKIEECPKLKGDLPSHLPALEQLVLRDCEQLACSLPRALALRELRIVKANKVMEYVFEAIIHKQLTCLQDLCLKDCSSAMPMSFVGDCLPASLKTLEIERFRKLEFPRQQQHKHELLEILEIRSSCDSLTYLPLESFPNLNKLSISDCKNLESVSQSGDVSLQNLSTLVVYQCPKLVTLAREGLAAPNLTRLVVSNCNKLESLPRGMNTLLQKLETLAIYNCPRIESFPEQGMPPSLREIEISNCEKLVSGLAWPSMDMLTRVRIDGALQPSFGKDFIPSQKRDSKVI